MKLKQVGKNNKETQEKLVKVKRRRKRSKLMKVLRETNLGVVILITSFSYSSEQALHSIFVIFLLSNNRKTEPRREVFSFSFKRCVFSLFPLKSLNRRRDTQRPSKAKSVNWEKKPRSLIL